MTVVHDSHADAAQGVRGFRWLTGIIALLLLLAAARFVRSWTGSGRGASETVAERSELVLTAGGLQRKGEAGFFTGLILDRHPGGTLRSRSAVSNGLLHGVSEAWHTNGVRELTENFLAGRSDGVRTRWDAAGNRVAETAVRNGKLDGLHREWHANGQLAVELTLRDGLPEGVSRRWSADGNLVGEWMVRNGAVVPPAPGAPERSVAGKNGGRP